jgi:hypothetical protein
LRMARQLTDGEMAILTMVQTGWGPQNRLEHVIFSERDEAYLFVRDSDGSMPGAVNLTVIAMFRADGTVASDEELKRRHLHLPAPIRSRVIRWVRSIFG